MEEDEEGVLYDENRGFNISPSQRRKKKSTFAPQKSKFIQHFPGGYKIESEVPAGTPMPFHAPMMSPYVGQFPGYASPYPGMFGGTSPYHYPPTHPYFGGVGYGQFEPGYVASKI